jgi:glutathione S-transferase
MTRSRMSKATIAKRLGYLNDQFAKRQFLLGGNFTVADAHAFTIVKWTNFVGIDDLKPYPKRWGLHSHGGGAPESAGNAEGDGLLK